MQLEQQNLLIVTPSFLVNFGVQMVVPPLPALLASSVELIIALLQFVGDSSPIVESDFCYDLGQDGVFLGKAYLYIVRPIFAHEGNIVKKYNIL